MIGSKYVDFSIGTWLQGRLTIELISQNIPNNQSVYNAKLYISRKNNETFRYWNSSPSLYMTISGSGYSNSTKNRAYDWNISSTWILIREETVTVTHNANGTPPSSTFYGAITDSVQGWNGNGTLTYVFPTIPRASSFTLGGATRTNADINVTIAKKSSSFNHRVRWRISGSTSWKEVQNSSWSGTSTSFKVQPSDIPNSKSKEIVVGVQTYSGSTAVGSEVTSRRTITIPNTSISLSGTAITGNSQTVSISNSGGSLTYTRSWTLGSASGGDSNSWTPPHSALSGTTSGTLTCTVVTKNGTATINTTSATRTITAPNASSFTLSGATETNANITVSISKTSSSFNHSVRWRVSGSTSWKTVQDSSWSGTSTSFKVQPSDIPNSKSKEIVVGVQTYSGSTTIRSEVTSRRTITIPNTTITLSGTANTGSAQTVDITNSGGSLTYTKSWTLGSATGGNVSSWTPPHSALPSSTSGTLTCTVVTKNGTATINTVSATRTITVPTSVLPTFGSITHTEYVSDVSTKVGAYVQGKTRLTLGVTSPSAGSGSSIKSYSISVAGHTVSNGGTTPVINKSGTLTITATVTDNRNRTATKTTTISVLAYENPIITGVSFTRSNADGTPNTTGTYLTIKATIRVRRLVVGGVEKNKIWYQSQSAQMGGSYTTKTDLENQAGTINGNYRESVYTHTFSGYPVDYPYNVRVRGGDIFSWSGYIAGGIPTGLVLQHWGESTTAFGKMIDSLNYNVLVGAKGMKVDGSLVALKGVAFADTRSVSDSPQDLPMRALSLDFKSNSSVGNPPVTAGSTYSHIINVAGWNSNEGSGGWPTQISVGGSGIAVRQATSATAWGPWKNIAKPSWSEITGKPATFAPSSHTHSGTETTGANTTHKTAYGTISLGPANNSYNHINSTLAKPFYMYHDLLVAGGEQVWHSGNRPIRYQHNITITYKDDILMFSFINSLNTAYTSLNLVMAALYESPHKNGKENALSATGIVVRTGANRFISGVYSNYGTQLTYIYATTTGATALSNTAGWSTAVVKDNVQSI